MASNADFTIDADPFANLGFDASAAQVVALKLEDSPALDVRTTNYRVIAKSLNAGTIAELGDPGSAGASPSPNPQDELDITLPAGVGSWLIQCQINGGNGFVGGKAVPVAEFTKQRIIAVRTVGGLREIVPSESTEYDGTFGWTAALSELMEGGAASFKDPVRVVTDGALPASTRVGNTRTADGLGALPTVDGVALVVGDSLLDKDEGTAADRGVWVVDDVGSGGTSWAQTRRADFDEDAEVRAGVLVPVGPEGTAKPSTLWTLATADEVLINTTSLTFTEAGGGVFGPGSSTDEAIARFDGTSGVLLQNSTATITDAGAMTVAGLVTAVALAAGTAPFADAGDFRGPDTLQIRARNAGDGANISVIAADGADNVEVGGVLGGDTRPTNILIDCATAGSLRRGGVSKLTWTNNTVQLEVPELTIGATHTAPIISQEAESGDDATGELLTLRSQPVTGGGTTIQGADLRLQAGDADTGSATTRNGGDVYMIAGLGGGSGFPGEAEIRDSLGQGRVQVTNGGGVNIRSTSNVAIYTGAGAGLLRGFFGSTAWELRVSNLEWQFNGGSPVIRQNPNSVDDTTGDPFNFHAQDVTGGGAAIVGGALIVSGGAASGAATLVTGGGAWFRSGDGDDDNGELLITSGDVAVSTTRARVIAYYDEAVGDSLTFGGSGPGGAYTSAGTVNMLASGVVNIFASSAQWVFSSSALNMRTSVLSWHETLGPNPIIRHDTDSASDVTGDLMTIHAQGVDGGGTTITGGALLIHGGDASGAATNDRGGSVTLRGGDGTTRGGDLNLAVGSGGGGAAMFMENSAGDTLIEIDDTGMAFFNGSTTAQPTITGARDNPEGALASLLTALAAFGLVVDSTTAS